jgi:twinkle protein
VKTIEYDDFKQYMNDAEPITKILSPSAWRDEINELILSGDHLTGAMLPWQKTHEQIRFRGGEVTLWQGINGHGKSQVLGMASIGFAAQGEGVCIASFEMRPAKTYMRMLRQIAQTDNPSKDYSDKVLGWMEDKIWIYDHLGSVQAERIYAAIKYCAVDLKLKHFIIDNLMKCVRNEDDYNGQKMFIDKICALSREYNIHIHVVHHVRKGSSENDMPGKFDARGSGTIVDQVDQVLTVWRNKKKEEMMRNPANHEEWSEKPDCLISCDKHRHGEWEGLISLWYNRKAMFYCPDKRCLTYSLMDNRIYEGQK